MIKKLDIDYYEVHEDHIPEIEDKINEIIDFLNKFNDKVVKAVIDNYNKDGVMRGKL